LKKEGGILFMKNNNKKLFILRTSFAAVIISLSTNLIMNNEIETLMIDDS
jgi:hypothetical protein